MGLGFKSGQLPNQRYGNTNAPISHMDYKPRTNRLDYQYLKLSMPMIILSLTHAKKAKIALVAAISCGSLLCSFAETQPSRLSFPTTCTIDESPAVPQAFSKAEAATAERPAEQDPGGNWGAVTNGVQMSLRAPTNCFTPGTPVPLVAYFRNLGPATNSFPTGSGENYHFEFRVLRDGVLLQPRVPRFVPHDSGSGTSGMVLPGTQIRIDTRLDQIFDLRVPGVYQVTASRRVPSRGSDGAVAIHSGIAVFRVTPQAEQGPANKETNTVSQPTR
jgi:hypothetical protein